MVNTNRLPRVRNKSNFRREPHPRNQHSLTLPHTITSLVQIVLRQGQVHFSAVPCQWSIVVGSMREMLEEPRPTAFAGWELHMPNASIPSISSHGAAAYPSRPAYNQPQGLLPRLTNFLFSVLRPGQRTLVHTLRRAYCSQKALPRPDDPGPSSLRSDAILQLCAIDERDGATSLRVTSHHYSTPCPCPRPVLRALNTPVHRVSAATRDSPARALRSVHTLPVLCAVLCCAVLCSCCAGPADEQATRRPNPSRPSALIIRAVCGLRRRRYW